MPLNNEYKSRSVGSTLTGGTTTTVYTTPTNWTAHVVVLLLVNHGNSNKTVTVEWYDTSNSTWYHIVGGYTVSGYNFLKLTDGYLVLNSGDKIRVTTEAGSSFDCTVTVEEYFDPARS